MIKLYKLCLIIIVFLNLTCAANNNETVGDLRDEEAKIQQMGKERNVKSVDYLINKFNNSSSDAIRLEAAKALGEIGAVQAIPVFKKALKIEQKQIIRVVVQNALNEINKQHTRKQ